MDQSIPGDVAPVYITDQLAKRANPKPDFLREKLALQDLARLMMENPLRVLPRMVESAMDITGAVSGGISLYEPDPAPGIFRWHHLRGEFAKFAGTTTPRNYSPCGITLDCNSIILVQHPERVYTWLRDANVPVPECLLVPLRLGGNEPLGTLWVVSDKEGHFDQSHAAAILDLAAFAGIALKMASNEDKLKEAFGQQEVLTREMGHRVKNVFAIADGMIRMTARSASNVKEMSDALTGRLHALSAANNLVRKMFDDSGEKGDATEFDNLIRTILRPYDRPGLTIEGPAFNINAAAINSIALFFHELATNAAKYGALSDDKGTVAVTWSIDDGALIANWVEHGGPNVKGPPIKKGFGTLLAERTIESALDGKISADWKPEGVSVVMRVPLRKIEV